MFVFITFIIFVFFALIEWDLDKDNKPHPNFRILVYLKNEYFSVSAFRRYLAFWSAAVRLFLLFLVGIIKTIGELIKYLRYLHYEYKYRRRIKKQQIERSKRKRQMYM